jgi:hypothetical protein
MAPFRAADLLRRKPVAQVEGEHPPPMTCTARSVCSS